MAVPDSGVSTRVVRPIAAGLLMHGADVPAALARVGLDPATLADPDARVPHRAAAQLWALAVELTGDEAFGLHVAEAMDLNTFDVLIHAFMSSATLGEGVERIVRYHRLNHDAALVSLVHENDTVCCRHELPGGHRLPAAAAQFVIATMVCAARAATEIEPPIREVRFQYDPPARLESYARVLQAPVAFGQPYNEVAFAAAALDLPLSAANPSLAAVLDRHAQACLDALPRVTSFVDRVRELLTRELQGGNPSADHIADKLGMSTRTLARRLKDEGTSHKEVLETLRSDLARRYLRDPELAISEVAFMLGFSEPSAFHRAFKRWTQATPAEFRKSA